MPGHARDENDGGVGLGSGCLDPERSRLDGATWAYGCSRSSPPRTVSYRDAGKMVAKPCNSPCVVATVHHPCALAPASFAGARAPRAYGTTRCTGLPRICAVHVVTSLEVPLPAIE